MLKMIVACGFLTTLYRENGPRTPLRELTALPRPLSSLRGLCLKEGKGERKEKEGLRRKGTGGKGRKVETPLRQFLPKTLIQTGWQQKIYPPFQPKVTPLPIGDPSQCNRTMSFGNLMYSSFQIVNRRPRSSRPFPALCSPGSRRLTQRQLSLPPV